MSEPDYQAIGLKCGLECHQELDTGKLFCRCPGILQETNPDYRIRRQLRPVVSELGEYDQAALEAFQKELYYEYEAYNTVNCLVCTDDEPPKPANEKALEVALLIALMTDSTVLPRVPVMRKLVIDGSNTSGFQRTALMAVNGALQMPSGKKIGIQSLALEEDSARPMQKASDHIVYRIDRLGIPLIELATAPDISTPQEAKETALAIGTLFRRTCHAKRGLGSIRQDLNVSIAQGARVEIKGVQELDLIDEFVKREIARQQSLIEIRDWLQDRKIQASELDQPMVDCSEIFGQTQCTFLKAKNVLGIKVPHFVEIFGTQIQPDRRFGTEVAGYVKVKTGLQGLLHSDELPNYGISTTETENVRQKLHCRPSDAFVLVAGPQEKAERALHAVIERCQVALEKIPNETRQALDNGNTEYLRPMPGAARMYPETDLQPIEIPEKQVRILKKNLPLTPEQRIELYTRNGLSRQLAENMKLDNWACFFEEQLAKKRNPAFVAWVLLEGLTQLEREKTPVEKLDKKNLDEFFACQQKGLVLKENALEILAEWSKNPSAALKKTIRQKTSGEIAENELQQIVEKIVSRNEALVKQKGLGAMGALMGDAMKELRGKASGEKVSALLKKAIEKKLETHNE